MKDRACFQAPCPYCVYRNEKVVDCHRGSGDKNRFFSQCGHKHQAQATVTKGRRAEN